MNEIGVNRLIIHMLRQKFVNSLQEMFIEDDNIHIIFSCRLSMIDELYGFIGKSKFFRGFESVLIKNKENEVTLRVVDPYLCSEEPQEDDDE